MSVRWVASSWGSKPKGTLGKQEVTEIPRGLAYRHSTRWWQGRPGRRRMAGERQAGYGAQICATGNKGCCRVLSKGVAGPGEDGESRNASLLELWRSPLFS